MISDFTRSRMRLFFIVAMMAVISTQIVVSGVSWTRVQHALTPAMERKAAVIADFMSERISRALGFGIPLDRLEGVEDYFGVVLRGNPDIAWIALVDDRKELFTAGRRPIATPAGELSLWEKLLSGDGASVSEAAHPVQKADRPGVRVIVAGDPAYARQQMRDVLLDLLAVMLVSFFIAIEFVRFTLNAYLIGPLEVARRLMEAVEQRRLDAVGEAGGGPVGRTTRNLNDRLLRLNASVAELAAQSGETAARSVRDLKSRFTFASGGAPRLLQRSRVADARLFTFLFMFSEGLARPFLPVYVKGFTSGMQGASDDIAAGLPITAFMLVVAFTMPFAGSLSQRMGRRSAFILGAALSAFGLMGSGLAITYYDLIAWRVLDGLGYAIMFMACQDLAIESTPKENRAQGIAIFVGGIMAAEICAPAVGGILADRIGDRATFLLSASLTTIVLLMALGGFQKGETAAPAAKTEGGCGRKPKSLVGMLARNHRFLTLALFAGIPAKMLLTGFLFFMVPVFLSDLGASRSEIGRVAMIYGVPTLFLTVMFSRIADKWRLHGFMAGAGGLIASLGMLPILFWTDIERVMLAVFALGLGQAMSISPQITLAAKLTELESGEHGHGPVLGVYRLIERCGSALGPVAFGLLTAALGHVDAMALGGALTAASVLIFCVVLLVVGVEDEEEEDDASEDAIASSEAVANVGRTP